MKHRKPSEGQSIVEALIIVVIVMILVTGLVVSATTSVKNTNFSSAKTTALKLAQEGIETTRTIRDRGWVDFADMAGAPEGRTRVYCLDSSLVPEEGLTESACAGNIDMDGIMYGRSLELTVNDSSSVQVVSTVRWQDGANQRKSEVVTTLTNWQ